MLCGINLRLAAGFPVAMLGGNYDDLHFITIADALLDGHWLGHFDQLTLAHGPFYPMFLALVTILAIPVHVATQCVYLLGSLVVARVAGSLTDSRATATFCFARLALSPVPFDYSAMWFRREPLYDGLVLLVLGLAGRVFLWTSHWVAGMLLGLAVAAFWLTREEGVFLLPSLCLLSAWRVWPCVAHIRRGTREAGLVRAFLPSRQAALVVAIPVISCLIPILLIAGIDDAVYGVFRTNDFQHGPFPDAFGALSRIQQNHWQRYVPVPRDARERAYSVSDAARELKPFLEGDLARYWIPIGCTNHPIPDCDDFQSGWFVWALRDAAAAAGHYVSATDADRFYRRLADEINAACDAQTVPCGAPRSGLLPPFRSDYIHPILTSIRHVVDDTVALGPLTTIPWLRTSPGVPTERYRRFVFGSHIVPQGVFADAPGWQIAGWVVGSDPTMNLSIAAPPATAVKSDLLFSPDAVLPTTLHRDATISQRFSDELYCQPVDCTLRLSRGDTIVGSWPVATLAPGRLLDQPEAAVHIDLVTPLPAPFAAFNRPTLRLYILEQLARFVPLLTTAGLPIALIWVGWITVGDIRRRRLQAMTAFAAAVLLALIARVAMLGLLDATSWQTEFRYEFSRNDADIGFGRPYVAGVAETLPPVAYGLVTTSGASTPLQCTSPGHRPRHPVSARTAHRPPR